MPTRYGPKHRAKAGRKHGAGYVRGLRRPSKSTSRPAERRAPNPRPMEAEAFEDAPVNRRLGASEGERGPTARVEPVQAIDRKPATAQVVQTRETAAPPKEDFFSEDGHSGSRTNFFGRSRGLDVEPSESKAPAESVGQFLKELPVLIVVALAIAILVKTFVMQAFFIPSGSMENTLQVGDRVLVAKFLYRFTEPKQGDIVVFVSPLGRTLPEPERNVFGRLMDEVAEGLGLKSSEQDFIKRVVATEGQTVEIKVGSLYVNHTKISEPYLHDQDPLPDFPLTVVPEGKVFVMGDNRSNSEDSRVFGPISESSILGRAFVLIWPLDRIRWLGG